MDVQSPAPLSRTLPAVPESAPRLRRAVTQFATALGATGATLEKIGLAVSEAVSNVVVHAYADRDQPGPVSVTAKLHAGSLHVTVSDEGSGMVPRLNSPGLGLGLPLISQTADSFDVQRAEGGGTEMRMSFQIAG